MIVPRGPDGLSVPQHKVLMELANGCSLTEACRNAEVNRRTFNSWMASPAFGKAFDELFSLENLKGLKKTLDLASIAAVEVYEDAIENAVKKIRVERNCDSCGEKQVFYVDIEDWRSKLHAADTLLKISGLLIERRHDKIEVEHTIALDTMQMAELMGWRAGIILPPDREAWYREHGFIKPGEQPRRLTGPAAIEGDFRELSEEET